VRGSNAMIRLGRGLGRIILLLGLAWFVQPGAPPSVTLAFLGDVMLGRGIAAAGASPAEVMGSLTPRLASADLVLANLESPLTDAPVESASDYVLCAPPGQVQVLVAAGVDVVSLANNHSRDCGEQGLDDTRASLSAADIQALGPEPSVTFLDVRSVRLALIALDDVSRPAPLAAATKAIVSARASGALVVVSLHWGAEYQSVPSQRQRAVADMLIRSGADIVWGHHPHVLQAAEREECDRPGGCLVLYSLGNAVFDQPGLADTRRSAAVFVRVDNRGVTEVSAVPFSIDIQSGRLIAASPADAEAVMQRLGPEALLASSGTSR
jgi:poly-gamma-glutamate capsule biosynthesis protein CapA/YwtB (metallophosphatase superfamily)